MPQRSSRHLLAIAVALAGIVVSVVMLRVEMRLEQDPSYVSFCHMGERLSCDAVLGSRWARLLELPLPIWAMAAFGVGIVAALPGAVLGAVGGLADVTLLALAGGSLGFAIVLLWVATALIGTACPLCLLLDGLILAWVVVLLPSARTVRAPRGWTALVGSLLAALAGGFVWATAVPAPASTVAEIRERHPDFVSFYQGLDVVSGAASAGAGARWAKGPASAPVTIVEFSDFQCPACLKAFSALRELAARRGDVRVVFRHFPLDPSCNELVSHALHPEACLAAAASECAGEQGRFWEYHDRLFEHQSSLGRDNFFRYARELGLDVDAFRRCLDAPETLERVRRDVAEGARLEIASTPTLFINERRLEGSLDRAYYDFAITIEKEDSDAR